jgi:hypothetical protein
MDDQDQQYIMNALSSKSTELFQQSIISEAKMQRMTDIIQQQQVQIKELTDQLQNLSKPSPSRRKKSNDSGEF